MNSASCAGIGDPTASTLARIQSRRVGQWGVGGPKTPDVNITGQSMRACLYVGIGEGLWVLLVDITLGITSLWMVGAILAWLQVSLGFGYACFAQQLVTLMMAQFIDVELASLS